MSDDFFYKCQNAQDEICAEECIGLDACQDCQCATVPVDAGGDWGELMDVVFCLFPILFLVVVTIKPNPYPTTLSLPMAAGFMFLVRLMYLGSDPVLTSASIVLGLHEALVPLSIMAGAITLFETMEATYCMPYMMREMKALTAGHPVAELMLIFCFAYMIEGASGFGTPVALGAPMLVSTGHSKLKSVVTLLVMNTFATVWGAVGTPIWFGFDGLVDEDGFNQISLKAAVCLAICSFLLVPLLLRIICPWELVKKNLIFIWLSLCTVVGPSLGISFGSYEFPSLIGGMVGCAGTALLIKRRVGLSELEDSPLYDEEDEEARKDHLEIGSVSDTSLVKRIEQAKSTASKSGEQSNSNRKTYNQASSSISDVTSDIPSRRPGDVLKMVEEEEVNGQDQTDRSGTADSNIPSERAVTGSQKEETTKPSSNNHKENPILNTPDTLESAETAKDKTQQEEIDAVLGPRKEFGEGYVTELVMRTSPIWLVVLLLVLTRVEQIGIKEYLTKREPNFSIHFGTYGVFRLSPSLVFQLNNILTYPGLNWKYEFLYLPFIMPFVLVSFLTMFLYRKDLQRTPREICQVVAGRLANPAIALLGALSLVQLLTKVSTAAPAFILGTVLSDWFEQAFIIITPLLGALGSFFSGSTTVSNLTFGAIQQLAAESIGISETSLLALQAVGASAGNGICLNNIIAACAVVGLDVGEGAILKETYKFVLGITTISTVIMFAFFIRF